MDYRSSGVDIGVGHTSVELMKQYVKRTLRPEAMGNIGGFPGAFSLAGIKNIEDPVLLPGTDGVGTKLKIAFLLNRHDTTGIDCVAMCVNDVAYVGGEPLLFLDYIARGKNALEKIATTISGIAEGCAQAGCALVGDETAEYPGLMPENEYDLAGSSVGACDRKDLITGEELKPGDVLIGIAPSGVYSDGFSLVRSIFEVSRENLTRSYPELGTTLGEVLLASTCIYVKALKSAKEAGVRTHACSHITGGGFYGNVSHMLKDGVHAETRKDSYEVPAIFRLMAERGEVSEYVMYNTSNVGVGVVVVVDPADVEKTIEVFRAAGEKSFVIGECKAGEKGVDLC